MEHGTNVARVPSAREVAVRRAVELLVQVRLALEPALLALSEDERKRLPPVPVDLPTVGGDVLQAAAAKPALPELVVGYRPGVVAERLAEAQALSQLSNQLESLARAVGDTRNAGLAEAYRSLLSLYGVAKRLAQDDASYDPIARPLADLFDERAAKRAKPSKTAA